jgi:four helix bundle protein
LVRSGKSIGSNICEAEYAQCKADFIKMPVALKEASETKYWLELLSESNITSEDFTDKKK